MTDKRSAEGAAVLWRSRGGLSSITVRGSRSGSARISRTTATAGLRGRLAAVVLLATAALLAAVILTTAAMTAVVTAMVTTAPTATAIITAATTVAAAAIAVAAVTGDRDLFTAQEGNAQDREQDRDTKYKRAIHS